jgi:hypothetical protein
MDVLCAAGGQEGAVSDLIINRIQSSVDATALPQGDADADSQSTAQTMTEGTTWARRLRPRR